MDLTTLAALIAALGGTAGLAALVKAVIDGRNHARQHDLDVLREVVDSVQDENHRMSDRLIAYETTIIELRNQVREQKLEIEDLRWNMFLHPLPVEDLVAIFGEPGSDPVKVRNRVDKMKERFRETLLDILPDLDDNLRRRGAP